MFKYKGENATSLLKKQNPEILNINTEGDTDINFCCLFSCEDVRERVCEYRIHIHLRIINQDFGKKKKYPRLV